MTKEQEIAFLKAHVAMLQETANSAEMALRAQAALLDMVMAENEKLRQQLAPRSIDVYA
jgi:hypothetical protein